MEDIVENIIIDEVFRSLLPALSTQTYALLEENILQNGCRDSLVLWGDILIDGHNRYEICTKHDIPFNVIKKDFATRHEAIIWVISIQISRRNLTPIQLSYYRGLHYLADKNLGANNEDGIKNLSTATRLAQLYNVSRNTINRDAKIAAALDAIGDISPPAKEKILAGEISIDKKELEELSVKPHEELLTLAASIEEGIYVKKKLVANEKTEKDKIAVSIPISNLPPNAINSKIAADFYAELQKIAQKDNKAELKAALRLHIDLLEDLYRKI
ncbi:MAG: hypothetical protein FWG43_05710 [Clostridiales bacterium]|nr:hypothetical protein [Clostridiales bacterium]